MRGAEVRTLGLEKRFASVVALRGVDLKLSAGQALAVLGPNGAGKSTLLRIVAGLTRPTAGRVEIAGEGSQAATGPAARSQIGFVGHATLLYNELTARENLIFAGRLYGVPEPGARADRLLEEEGLADVGERLAGTFSRGMAQRLSIARALIHDPDLVLLDEPFTGLDRRSADRLAERLGRIRRQGRTLMLVTHDVRQAARIADRVLVLVRGQATHQAATDGLSEAGWEALYLDATAAADRAAAP